MGIREYDSQQELDDDFERYEELCFKYLELQAEVNEKEEDLKYALKELADFQEDYPAIN